MQFMVYQRKGWLGLKNNFSFDYLLKVRVLAKVTVQGENVYVENYIDDIIDRPFGKKERNLYLADLERLFEYRCLPKSRANVYQVLEGKFLGYNRYAIIRETHGIMVDDYYWLRFDDEKDLCWDDVKHWKYH